MPDLPPAPTETPAFWRELVAKGEFWFGVSSDSMAPTLVPGDQVRVRPLDRSPQPGEVTVFLYDGHLVVHRCLGDGRFRGDGRLVPDPPVAANHVVGLAVAGRRGERQWHLADSLPWRTRIARIRLRCSRFLRRCQRLLARMLRPLRR